MNGAKTSWLGIAVATLLSTTGCEIISKIDRSQLDQGNGGASSTSSSSSGSMAECTEATVDQDCPDPGNECLVRSCTASKCDTAPAPTGTEVVVSDCFALVCNGNGQSVAQNAPAGTPCDMGICTGDGACMVDGGGGAGGGSGSTPCSTAAECGQASACATPVCNGVCETNFAAMGTLTASQTAGDCQDEQCDGNGSTVLVPNTSDTDDNNDCTADSCNGSMPTHTNLPSGTACTNGGLGQKCNNAGACVECLTGADCTSNVCMAGACAAPTCTDGVANNVETDVDCGGGVCPTCINGKVCSVDGDCLSTVCGAGLCAESFCSDNRVTGNEVCDDGNTNNGDCCSSACGLESGCEVEPNNTPTAANAFSDVFIANKVKGFIHPSSDSDFYSIMVPSGTTGTLTAKTMDGPLGSTCAALKLDTVLFVLDSNGTELGFNDDNGANYCSFLTLPNLAAGIYYVRVASFGAALAFDYTLNIQFLPCGDGTILGADECEDGNTIDGDGCSSACTIEPGYSCSGAPSVCALLCGNGLVDFIEQCDDGNASNSDGCSSTCGIEPEYICSGAPSVCVLSCGDGIFNGFDECDDGNASNSDGCSSTCTIEPGYVCSGAPSMCALSCPDGTVNGFDQCDDGNMVSSDGCSSTCTIEPGYICSGTPSVCVSSCGDGAINGADQCDDGNAIDGDGCSSTCTVETDQSCTGTPSVCTPYETNCNDTIDNDGDGNADAADNDCVLPAYFPGCALGQTLRVYKSLHASLLIPDADSTGITSTAFVVDNIGNIASSAMLLNITHTWDADLRVTLTSPANVSFVMTNRYGADGDDYTNTLFHSDPVCPPILTGSAPFSGCFAPEDSLTPLVGTPAQGTWQLRTIDSAFLDVGALDNWALVLCIQ